jgi:threonine dehydrogenase-like Zn-dependent dehydrogenase
LARRRRRRQPPPNPPDARIPDAQSLGDGSDRTSAYGGMHVPGTAIVKVASVGICGSARQAFASASLP